MSMFDEWEAEEAAARAARFERDQRATRDKMTRENARTAAGIGVYTPDEIAAHKAEAEAEEGVE